MEVDKKFRTAANVRQVQARDKFACFLFELKMAHGFNRLKFQGGLAQTEINQASSK